jgi:hypothetical protein
MKILGAATELSTTTTKFATSSAVWVFNTDTSAAVVTLRNADDDTDTGSIYVGPNSGIVVNLSLGDGLRGANTLYGTHIANSGV